MSSQGPNPADRPPAEEFEPGGRSQLYCHRCGSLLDWATAECIACGGAELPRSPPRPQSVAGSGSRSLWLALSLHFVFLLCTLAVILARGNKVTAGFIAQAVDSFFVLVWMGVAWGSVRAGLTKSFSPIWLLAAMGLSLVTFTLASVVAYAASAGLGLEIIEYSTPILEQGHGMGMVLLSVCLQPAIIEELAFRGVIFSAVGSFLRTGETIVVSALLFMVIHLAVLSFPHLLFTGLVLGWLRARTGSLYPGMVLHFFHNLLVVIQESATSW